MDETSPPSPPPPRRKFWRRPTPYVVLGLVLGPLLVPAILFAQSLHADERRGFIFEPVANPEQQYPDRQVVNLTPEQAARLPGHIPDTLAKAKATGRADTAVSERQQRELVKAFGVNPDDWHWTLLRYQDTVYSWAITG